MKILMISTDRALLGEEVSTGDAVKRHRDYGKLVERLDIIVFCGIGYQTKELSSNVFCYPTNSPSKFFYIGNSLTIAEQLNKENKYDLIVCQDPFFTGFAGLRIKKKYGPKLLVHFHGDFWQNKYWLKENFFRYGLLAISKFVINKADFVRVVSQGIKDKLVGNGVRADKIRVIATPVDFEEFSNFDNQTVSSIQAEFYGKKIILWAGKMMKEKNLEFLIKVFGEVNKKYQNAILLLAGNGKDFQKLNKLRLELMLHDSVKMIGHVPYSRLANYFHAADIFVLPSLHESFGKVLLEAGAAAKPVVASRTTGASEIIKDAKTGFLVAINDKEEFIKKLLSLLEHEELAKKMGKTAYGEISQKYNYRGGIEKIVSFWEEIGSGFKIC